MIENNKDRNNFEKEIERVNHLLDNLSYKCILGINYSGMHESAFALVSPEGQVVYATALERISRNKQDGGDLLEIFQLLKWKNISSIALSTEQSLKIVQNTKSKVLKIKLPNIRNYQHLSHAKDFNNLLPDVGVSLNFSGHEKSHAAIAFYGSGFDECICLTCDGGMLNEQWFGGVFSCSKKDGIKELDLFDSLKYAKISTLYAFVTALLEFTPLKHEGKLTGLAAYGRHSQVLNNILQRWFEVEYYEMEKCLVWINQYSNKNPQLVVNPNKIIKFRKEVESFSKADIALAVQEFTEKHILEIISNFSKNGWNYKKICLSGGLFANVRLNKKVLEKGFSDIFIAPAMGDDGTAIGAALIESAKENSLSKSYFENAYFGSKYPDDEILEHLNSSNIVYEPVVDPGKEIAELLAKGMIVAVFQGKSEFGPRSLGNRSILAPTGDAGINESLNNKLKRTEFMPFAPVTRLDDVSECYLDFKGSLRAMEFMTITVECTKVMKRLSPAVVHIDGTARPQIVAKKTNNLIYDILTHYKSMTGIASLVNTSFNVHEEPIVCSIKDALKGFFLSKLDFLYIENIGLISFKSNLNIAENYLINNTKKNAINFKHEFFYEKYFKLFEGVTICSSELVERTKTLTVSNKALEDVHDELEARSDELEGVRSELVERTKTLHDELEARSDELEGVRSELVERTKTLTVSNKALEDVHDELRGITLVKLLRKRISTMFDYNHKE